MILTSTDIATFALETPVGEPALAAAATAILDCMAVMFAGSTEDVVRRLAGSLQPQGDAGLPSFSTGIALGPEDAALLYGTAAHALDFDDVSMLAICHPTAPVLAALLACAPWADLTGPRLCAAHAVGTEVTIRMGQAIGFRHYELGFHSTATLGIFGAVAAVARLRGLDLATTRDAFAIAASLASGLRMNFGTMIKPLHVGIAAANALRAIAWAEAGVGRGHADPFAPGGFFEAFSGGAETTWRTEFALGDPFAIVSPGFEFKRYNCCYLLHKIIALGLEAAQYGARLKEIATLKIEMPRGGTRPLNHPRPSNGKEAQFSAPYAVLAAIHDGRIDAGSFDDAAVARPQLQIRLADVEVVEREEAALSAAAIGVAPVRLELRLSDGSTQRFECLHTPGSVGDPLSIEDLQAKWVDCLLSASALPASDARNLYDQGAASLKSGPLQPWLNAVWPHPHPAPLRQLIRAAT